MGSGRSQLNIARRVPRFLDYAGTKTGKSRVYGGVSRGIFIVNVVTLIVVGLWQLNLLLCDSMLRFLWFPVSVIIAAMQVMISVLPTLREMFRGEAPVHWAERIALITPMIVAAGLTVAGFIGIWP